MRCFVAVDLPEDVKEELSRIQSLIPEADMKTVEKKNLHLTLAFLGEIDESGKERCLEILKGIKANKFNAFLGKIGFFPSEDYIRVAWVSLEPSAIFKELRSQIYNNLKSDFSVEDKFESHVTLARIKKIKNRQEFIKEMLLLKLPEKQFVVNSFTLKKSTLTRIGPVYEDLAKFNLI